MDRNKYETYEEIHAKLAEAMQEACTMDEAGPFLSPTEDLSFMKEEPAPKTSNISAIMRLGKIAAIIIVMLLGMNLAMLAAGSNEAYSEKGLLHRIYEGARGIFTDDEGTEFVMQDDTGEVCEITSMDQIDIAKEFWPDLKVPQYIPEGYELESLRITRDISQNKEALYVFESNRNVCEIMIKTNYDYEVISQHSDSVIEKEDRIINKYWDESYNCYSIEVYYEDCIACIYGNLSENDILNIAYSLY